MSLQLGTCSGTLALTLGLLSTAGVSQAGESPLSAEMSLVLNDALVQQRTDKATIGRKRLIIDLRLKDGEKIVFGR